MDKNKNLNYSLSKTINNFHYFITIKITLNYKFIILFCFLSSKQHQTMNLSFSNFKTTQNKKCIVLYQYLLFQMVKFTISDSKFIVFSCFIKILDSKNEKNSKKFSFVIIFLLKIQHKTTNLLF